MRLQVISGTRGKKSGNTIPLPKSFHFYFIFFFFSSPIFFSSSPFHSFLLLLLASSCSSSSFLNSRDSPSTPLSRFDDPWNQRRGGSNNAPDFAPPRSLVIPAKKRRDPMRQRRWKRRRSDIFTGFTTAASPFLRRAWKAISWKLREPVGSCEWKAGLLLPDRQNTGKYALNSQPRNGIYHPRGDR